MIGYKIMQDIREDFGRDTLIKYVNNMLSMRSYVDEHRDKTGDEMYIVHCSRNVRNRDRHIYEAFDWMCSPQGHGFWENIKTFYE